MFKFKFSPIYLLPGLSGLLFYFPSIKYGFFQDDFIHLYSSRAESFSQFSNFFNPFASFPDIFFFRPLTTQAYFFLNTTLVGLNPAIFHLEALVLHVINSYLFYIVVVLLWKKRNIAIISSIFYSLSSIHFLSLYYISSFQELGRTFFIFIALIFYIYHIQKKSKLSYIITLVSFVAALLSKETSVVFPAILICFEMLRRRSEPWNLVFKQTFIKTIPFFIVLIGYLILRMSGFNQIFHEGEYSIAISVGSILQNLKWYALWIFGLPEILSTYPSLKPSSILQFTQDFPQALVMIGLFLILILSAVWSCLRVITSKKILILSSLLFIIPLLPVLVLNQHKYPQYLDLSMIVFLPTLIGLLISIRRFRYVTMLFGFGSFILIQFLSLQLTEQNHWATHRAEVASYYYQIFKKDYPEIENDTSIVFVGTTKATKELSVTLAKDYAFRVWFPLPLKDVLYLTNEGEVPADKRIVRHIDIF